MIAKDGQRNRLAEILLQAALLVGEIPACRLYAVCADPADENAVWVIELWDDQAAHDASLADERVRALIAQAMPLIGAPPGGEELDVLGGHGV